MSVNSNTLHSAGPGDPASSPGFDGGNVTLTSPQDRRTLGARIFSREWRALGDAAPVHKKSGPKSVKGQLVPPTRAHSKPHAVEAIHFARKGQTKSWLHCACGKRLACSDPMYFRSHTLLAEAHSLHRNDACKLEELSMG